MADERYSFSQARTRLEEIVTQVRKKDTSLEKSLDLLEEGVRLANVCTEQSDHTEWRSVVKDQDSEQADESVESPDDAAPDESAAGEFDAEDSDAVDVDDVPEANDAESDAEDDEAPLSPDAEEAQHSGDA